MLRSKTCAFPGLILCVAMNVLFPAATAAQTLADLGHRFYVDAGTTGDDDPAHTAALGMLIPSALLSSIPRTAGPLSLHWDVSLAHWRTDHVRSGRHHFTQLTGMGVWRHPVGGPDAPWFVDLGLGISIFDRLYRSGADKFSTAFQFTEAVGLGYRFGGKHAYEISLRAQHISNAGIKKPNPGENIVRLRFACRF
ncbi:acyloxyacyl hydrolase [Thauera linaloolentis]|uniref:Acyloxyacyl hydrolase n=1 Tax=Thauera linaloolentis (strain DSM 12138 / JCM 21573 / CCUG 41526 / CIP 105981 / IAM 15112 / NBRC 102519 / 47Lol) TaxID=1123367 RepID=N6YCW7_THAL4|nr:acyloxyacyl hydrolase [Thauera linaloolentis]ENO89350.1 hypothetical protein C666_06665 [Thauera linaloolentis 47Lol = DSM 12138]MCM8565000.1 acyloxyacyl hydrolase [Thauera linaloolentis]